MIYDLIIIGAGPCGLASGIEAKKNNLKYLIIEKGNIAESIRNYPINMTFFSTSEMIEIGNIPFTSLDVRPSRVEALRYYRKVVDHFDLRLKLFTKVTNVQKRDDIFYLETEGEMFQAKNIILAIGYYDVPKRLQIEGEDLPHVSHYYKEPYKYTRTKVFVVGGANSAIETALDLYRNGADVSLVHMFDGLDRTAKYWIVPDLENRIKKDEVRAYFNTVVTRIDENQIHLENLQTKESHTLPADFVFLMTGYRPDANFLQKIGVELNGPNFIPTLNEETFESNVPGIFIAGSMVGGEETAKIFIENGRYHGKKIIDHILKNQALQVS